MEHFPHDEIDPTRTHGDLLLQLCADEPDACVHALRILMRATRATLVLRWMLPGFQRPNTLAKGRTSTRNLLGFKDGTANLDASDDALMDELVWVRPAPTDEPAWTAGGSYMVVRIIRTKVEFWDRTALATQEDIIGRHKATRCAARRSSARTTSRTTTRTRRGGRSRSTRTSGWPTRARPDRGEPHPAAGVQLLQRLRPQNGQLEQGLLFVCFQRDLDRGFVTVQNRLNGEPLEEYIQPVGGGFFFALPGVRNGQDWFGRALLA